MVAQRKALTAEESTALQEKVAANIHGLQSLQSDFTQTRHLSYLENAERSAGKLYFKSPGKIRWEYQSPTEYVVIFDGQTMHTIEDDRTKTVDLATNRRMKGLSDLLLGTVQEGNMLDEGRFNITYHREKADYVAILQPKEAALRKYIQQVELTFDSSNLLLKQVLLTDPAGDSTQLAFTNQRKNAPIDAVNFTAVAVK